MKPKSSYDRFDFINPEERIYINRSVGYDGILPHNHGFIELVYIESGKGLHTINHKTFSISTGDLFLLSPNDTHSLQPLEDSKDQLYWINCLILPEFIDFDFNQFPSEYKYLGVYGFEMRFIFNEMSKEFYSKEPEYLKKIKAYLTIIIVELIRILKNPEKYSRYTNIRKHFLLQNALSFIHLNYKEDINLTTIISNLGISPSYLSKIFKENLGLSVISYINQYRMQESCRLLRDSSMTIGQVAIQSGFNDVKFFYTFFKRHLKLSPGKYRKLVQLDSYKSSTDLIPPT